MINFLRGMALIVAVAMIACVPGAATAQQQSRQDRIREHQERIRKILEESKKRRAEAQEKLQNQQQANPPEAPGAPAAANNANTNDNQASTAGSGNQQPNTPTAAQPGSPLPTGPIQNARMTPPIKKATPTPAAAAPQTARSESRTILLFHPLDSIVNVGDQFKTDVVAETKEGEIDEISVLLHYPRHSLSPLALDHAAIDPYVKEKIKYEFNPDEGTIYFHTKLKEPTRFAQGNIFSIVWEALEPNEGAVISYQFGKEPHTTGLYLKDSNLLGTLPGSEDGVIRTTVQVIGPKSKPTITQLESNDVMIGAKPPVTYDDRPEDQVVLKMRGPSGPVKAGETFDVPVYVSNPGEKRIDRLRLYLQFDPDKLQVVDYDAGNVVKRGVNIHDAEAREKFPFDFYRANMADNQKGTIEYEVSASTGNVRGSGRVATIRMMALQETPRAELVMVQNAEGLTPTTGVSFMGESQLEAGGPTQTARALEGVAVQVSGRAIANKGTAPADIYNPFVSNLARRMRSAGQ